MGSRGAVDSQQGETCSHTKDKAGKKTGRGGGGGQEVDVLHILGLQPVDAVVGHLALPLSPSLKSSDLLPLHLSATTVMVDRLLSNKVGGARDAQLAAEDRLGRQLLVLEHLVDDHLVGVLQGVHLHVVLEQLKHAPGELDRGEWEDSCVLARNVHF